MTRTERYGATGPRRVRVVGLFSALYGLIVAVVLAELLVPGLAWDTSAEVPSSPEGPLRGSAYTAVAGSLATWFFALRFALSDSPDSPDDAVSAVLYFVFLIPIGFLVTAVSTGIGFLFDPRPTVPSDHLAWIYLIGVVLAHTALGVGYTAARDRRGI